MKNNLSALITILIATLMQACVGYHTWLPESSTVEESMATEDLTRRLGEPDEVNQDQTKYLYRENSNDWCGTTIYAIIPIPFMAPVCDKETVYLVTDNFVEQRTTRQVRKSGVWCGPVQLMFSAMMDFGQNNVSWCD